MASRRKKQAILKNKKSHFLPFLHTNQNVLQAKYYVYNKLTKVIVDENKAKKKAKRKRIINICTFTFNIAILAVVLIVQLCTQDSQTVISPTVNWKYIAVLIGLCAGLIVMDATKIFILLFASTKKVQPILSYKTSALGKYYDNITPMSTGGQPFQIFYMNKRGVRGDIATGIPLMKYITWQIAYVLTCSFVLIFNSVKFGGTADPFTTTIAWLVTGFNVLIFTTIILLSVSKRFGPKLVIWILKLLAKMHIVKNYRKTFRKVMRFVVNYQKTFKTLLKKPVLLIEQLLLSFADNFVYNIIPFFVVLAFVKDPNIYWYKVFIQAIILTLTVGLVPTPGSSGAAEGIFAIMFKGAFDGALFWPLLTWRIITYYLPLLRGLLVLVYDFVFGNKKYERKKLALAGASPNNDNMSGQQTFRQTLDSNMSTIQVVQAQEEDKLPAQVFTGIEKGTYNCEDIIKDSEIVTEQEMLEKVKPAEDIMHKMSEKSTIKHINKKQKRVLKMQSKVHKKNKKKNK